MRSAAAVLLLIAVNVRADEPKTEPKQDPKAKANDAIREVAGAAEFLRSIPKKYATYQGVDAKTGKVKLLIDGDKDSTEWAVEPDAEIKLNGWWGRLSGIEKGFRVWVWFNTDRKKQPVSVLMIADEPSEQDIHGGPVKIQSIDDKEITIVPTKGKPKSYRIGKTEVVPICSADIAHRVLTIGDDPKGIITCGMAMRVSDFKPKAGDLVYLQSADDEARRIIPENTFKLFQNLAKVALRERWMKEGLPGTVSFVHLSGEADLMLDHETMRWARSLKTGDKVKIAVEPPINAVVKHVNAWRERTQVRVVINGQDLPGIKIGQRIHMQMTPPAEDVINADYPPDIDKPKTKEERLDWFLANTYCCCKVGGDGCTGHFYTLASCNPNACAAPNSTRKKIAEKIDEGLSNKQIWNDLKTERGVNMLKPHLAP